MSRIKTAVKISSSGARKIRDLIARMGTTEKSAAVSAASTRLGVRGAPERVWSAIKDNPVLAALTAVQVYGLADPTVQSLLEDNPELAEMAQFYDEPDNPVETDTVFDITRFEDEFRHINRAANALGGMDNLMALLRVIDMNKSVLTLHAQLKTMKGAI